MMSDTEVKQTLCMVLVLIYLCSLGVSIKRQKDFFNSNRFLEMSYFMISYYFCSMAQSGRLFFGLCFAFSDCLYLVIVARFFPDPILVTICSMLAYLW
jgi:hypothetical protein